jgi:dihydroorotase
MDCLIFNIQLIDNRSSLNQQAVDILIRDGIITQIASANQIPKSENAPNFNLIDGTNCQISIGWFDMRAEMKDPGLEYKETLATGARAAMQGGFTEVAILPNTQPVVQTKNEIAYIKRFAESQVVDLHPIAAVSVDTLGKDLTEMIDLHTAGAVAFSDGEKPIWHSDILVKTLLYLQKFNGLLIQRPEDTLLTRFGQMNEGIHSTLLGLKGIPHLAEEMMIQRDLSFLEYAGGKIHFSLISSAKSVQMIREAKQKGLQVTCDIAAHQIAFDDSVLLELDTNYKVKPPFRLPNDIAALWAGLADGTIDVVVSDHNPQDVESKNLEFDLAEFGIIGFETAFAVLNTFNKTLTINQLIEKISTHPRAILGLPIPKIEVGELANLTIFSTQQEWIFTEKSIRSKSHNSPFINQTFRGKPLAIIHKNQLYSV